MDRVLLQQLEKGEHNNGLTIKDRKHDTVAISNKSISVGTETSWRAKNRTNDKVALKELLVKVGHRIHEMNIEKMTYFYTSDFLEILFKTYPSLTTLKFKNCDLDWKSPEIIRNDYQSIKHLIFDTVEMYQENSHSVLSDCFPRLEYLKMIDCEFHRYLKIEDKENYRFDREDPRYRININMPNTDLESLEMLFTNYYYDRYRNHYRYNPANLYSRRKRAKLNSIAFLTISTTTKTSYYVQCGAKLTKVETSEEFCDLQNEGLGKDVQNEECYEEVMIHLTVKSIGTLLVTTPNRKVWLQWNTADTTS